MKDLETKNKKELVAIITQLQEKLVELQAVENKQVASESNLPGYAFSIVRSKEDFYHLVEIGFNFYSKAAKVDKITNLSTKDYADAAHRARMTLFDIVLNSKNTDHLKEK
jgi:hypothetical protein